MGGPIANYTIADHAAMEMRRRQIEEGIVGRVLTAPGQRHSVRRGRDVLQSRINVAGKTYLIRVFVDVDRDPAEVVAVY